MNKNITKLLLSAALLLCCFAASAAGTQPSTGDGSQANPYQIATSDDLVWFAEHVNSGNTSACAILTADITVNTGVLDSNGDLNGTPSNTWTPIGGQNGKDYSGEFDGDGHTISGLYFNDESVNNIGLFGKAVGNAHIHDLGVSDSYFCGSSWVGGICGDFGGGCIENCWNGATVISNGNGSCAGGIAGSCWTGASIAGCYNIGKISCTGSSYGGISGVVAKNSNVDASVKDCFTLNTACGVICNDLRDNPVITNSDVKDAAAFASGEVCYQLNNGVTDGSQKWYQTLGGTDSFPVLDNSHGTVFYGYDGNVLTYSNSPLNPPSVNDVAYIDANGVEQTAHNVFMIMNASEQVIWSAGWYVVQGADITLAKGAVCSGEVHLILADGAKLTATGNDDNKTPGIQVSGDGNTLAVYGQSAQSGQLIAIGRKWAAGIGGGWHGNHFGNGSNITINGGIVTATGGHNGAGIGGGLGGTSGGLGSYITITGGNVTANGGNSGAGIGGGSGMPGGPCLCSNITITGGKVTANGGSGASGIGGSGLESSSSNIIIAATLLVKADNFNNPPTTVIPNTGSDLAGSLNGKQHVTAEPIIITYGEHITVSPEFESGDNVAYGTYTFTAADRSAVVDDSYYEFLGFYKESTFNTPITEGVSGYVYTLTVNEASISVYAKYRQHFSVPYIDADGQEQTAADAGEIANNTLNAGWYVVRGSDENHGPLTCNGAVHIILADDAKLTATGWDNVPGITVSGEGNSLTIYGQTAQTGQLVATGGYDAAGIGGGWQGSGSNITINGGTVTANGGGNAAGIGGGYEGSGSNITIYGGTVTANGGRGGAGIGGGFCGSGYNIFINGGTVTANGGSGAPCIGGGSYGSGSDIFVVPELIVRAGNDNPPATVIAADRTAETDIAGDLDGKRYATVRIPQPCIVTYGDYITVSPQFASGGTVAVGTEITFTAADRFADNYEFVGFYKESTFENKITNGVSGLTYIATVLDDDISVYAKYKEFAPTPYIDANGQEQTANAAEITNETSTLNAGWYVVTGEVSRGNITCNGAVHLILADGAKLTATGGDDQAGITISGNGNFLTIYGQSAQSGQLFANGGRGGAGIGGGHGSGSNITINGGEVTTTGGQNAAGIGGGDHGSGSNITINGGTVTANGGRVGAGIGGGCMDAGSNITINGGTVTATGGEWASAIGGGWQGSGSNITINGGTVTANGGDKGASIGGGYEGSGWDIKVVAALTIYADNTNPPTSEILHTSDYDIAPNLAGKRYAVVKDDITGIKEAAIAAINAAIEGITNEDIIAIATNAIDAINAAINVREITIIKEQALAAIASAKAIYNSGLGEMGEPCEDCPSVEVTGQSDNTVKLYNPKSVKFKKE